MQRKFYVTVLLMVRLAVCNYFPDPWHKTKHHKRRIVQPHFVAQVVQKLAGNGFIHMATDWENYAEQNAKVLSANTDLVNTSKNGDYIPRPDLDL